MTSIRLSTRAKTSDGLGVFFTTEPNARLAPQSITLPGLVKIAISGQF